MAVFPGVASAAPALEASKTSSVGDVSLGEYFSYTLTAVNNGDSASRFELVDVLPAQVSLVQIVKVEGNPSCSTSTVGTPDGPATRVRCTKASLANGATVEVQLVVEPRIRLGLDDEEVIENTFTVDATNSDPVESDPAEVTINNALGCTIFSSGHPATTTSRAP